MVVELMYYKIKMKHFIIHASNRMYNKVLELESDTPSDMTMDWMEQNLSGFRATTKAITFSDTLENRLKLSDLDKNFVPVSSIKFESNLKKYMDQDLRSQILQALNDHGIYTAFIRYDGSNIVVSKTFRSKAKLAVVNESFGTMDFFKAGKVIETLQLNYSELPF